ncbi:MAG: hypothetical protein FJW35_04950 [Acidobacteria bacterium]|nr:hypothetical protein [Acidobacteriota bacterium]
MTLRVRVRGLSEKPVMPEERPGPSNPSRALLYERKVCFGHRPMRSRVYERARLRAGMKIPGPALVFEYSATTAIPPGADCRVDRFRNLEILVDRSTG